MGEIYKVALQADVGGFVSGMAQADSAVGRVGVAFQGLVNAGKAANSVFQGLVNETKKIGKEMIGVGAGLLGTATAWGISAAQFESNMRNVNTLLGLGSAGFAKLSGQVLRLGSAFPQGPNNAAQGMYEIVSAGYDASDATKVLQASLKAASAGMTDTNTAADAVIYAMKAYGLSTNQVNDVSDILFKTVDKGILKFEDLAQGMGEWVSMAAAAKVPLADASAALAAMTLAGAPPAEAATSLARLLQGFVQPSDALVEVTKKLGYETPQLMLNTLGLKGAMDALRVATGGNVTTILDLFQEIRAARGAFELMSNDGMNYANVASEITDKNQRAGATQQAFAAQAEGASFKFKVMINEIQRLAIVLGAPLLIPAKAFFDTIAHGAAAIADLPTPILALAAAVTVLSGAFLVGTGIVLAYGLKMTLTSIILQKMGESLLNLSAAAEDRGMTSLAQRLNYVGTAAEHSSGSMIKFGVNLTNAITNRIPILGTLLQNLGKIFIGVAAAAGVAAVAFVAWRGISEGIQEFNRSVDQIKTDKLKSVHFENLQETGDSLQILSEQADKASAHLNNMSDLALVGRSAIAGLQEVAHGGLGFIGLGGLVPESKLKQQIELRNGLNLSVQQAARDLEYLKGIGDTVSQTVFTDFWKSAGHPPPALKITTDQILKFADFKGIKLIGDDGLPDPGALKAVVDGVKEWNDQYGALPENINLATDAQKKLMDETAKYIDSVQQASGGAIADQLDPLSKFDNKYFEDKYQTTNKGLGHIKGAFKNVFSFMELSNFYGQGIQDTQNFLENIKTAVQKGFDPGFITRVIQAGPQQAGDLLDAVVNTTDSKFRDLINVSEARIRQLSGIAVQSAKMIAIATSPTASARITAELPRAQQIQQLQIAFPKIDDKQIADAMHTTVANVQRIANDYALTIPVHVPTQQELLKGKTAEDWKNLADGMVTALQNAMGHGATKQSAQYLYADLFNPLFKEIGMHFGQMTSSEISQAVKSGNFRNTLKQYSIDVPLAVDASTIRQEIETKLRAAGVTNQEEINLIVDAVWKNGAAPDILQQFAVTKQGQHLSQGQIDYIIGLKGDKEAGTKLAALHGALALTKGQQYISLGVIGDKEAQRKIIETVAKANHVNAQKVVVTIDADGAQFWATADDIGNKAKELDQTKIVTHVSLEDQAFRNKYDALVADLRRVDGLHATTYVDVKIGGPGASVAIPGGGRIAREGGIFTFADGGMMRYARGSRESHVAQIAKAGDWRLWAEPETGGEAYIPLAASKRQRSVKILQDVAHRFGMRLQKFAAGGIIAEERAREANINAIAGTYRNTASFRAAIAAATKGIDPAKDAQQYQEAVNSALQDMALKYKELQEIAGKVAADQLANSGLVGEAWDRAAQRLEDAKKNLDDLMSVKHDVGAISNDTYLAFLHRRLAGTRRFSQEWKQYWDQIQSVQDEQRQNTDDQMKFEYDHGQRSYQSYLTWLQRQFRAARRGTAQWRSVYAEIEDLRKTQADKEKKRMDYEYQQHQISTAAYLSYLKKLLAAAKQFSDEWYGIQDQIQQINASFSDPFKNATDAIQHFAGQAVASFTDVQNFLQHTLEASKKFMDDIKALKAAGLNQSFLTELLQAGPSSLPLAEAILAGGADAVKFINDTMTQINAITGQAAQIGGSMGGNTVTNTVTFETGAINIGAGNNVNPAQVQAVMNDAALTIVQAIRQGA